MVRPSSASTQTPGVFSQHLKQPIQEPILRSRKQNVCTSVPRLCSSFKRMSKTGQDPPSRRPSRITNAIPYTYLSPCPVAQRELMESVHCWNPFWLDDSPRIRSVLRVAFSLLLVVHGGLHSIPVPVREVCLQTDAIARRTSLVVLSKRAMFIFLKFSKTSPSHLFKSVT